MSSSLQDLVDEGQNIETELKSKRAQLWGNKNFELQEHAAILLNSSAEVAPPPETPATEESVEQPVQLQQEEAAEEPTAEPAQLQQEEATEEPTAEPAQLQQEEAAEEPTAEPAQLQQEEAAGEQTAEPAQLQQEEETNSTQLKPADSQTLYTGEVELTIAIPVELRMVSKLYNYLQTIPDIKILRTTGSWDRGTTITVVADKPIPLINIITEIPDVAVIAELVQKDSSTKRTSSSPQKAGGEETKRIKLTLKEAESL